MVMGQDEGATFTDSSDCACSPSLDRYGFSQEGMNNYMPPYLLEKQVTDGTLQLKVWIAPGTCMSFYQRVEIRDDSLMLYYGPPHTTSLDSTGREQIDSFEIYLCLGCCYVLNYRIDSLDPQVNHQLFLADILYDEPRFYFPLGYREGDKASNFYPSGRTRRSYVKLFRQKAQEAQQLYSSLRPQYDSLHRLSHLPDTLHPAYTDTLLTSIGST